ncbi:MAG: HAD family hydrolase [Bacteroidales bacterium]|nr:HAD family hydrolase [Bacteroidales bacterium]
MMENIKILAFDADDTLWDCQTFFDDAENFFCETLKNYGDYNFIKQKLFETESGNMELLGYGAKAVCISMMECALKISNYQISQQHLFNILSKAKSLLKLPSTPLPNVKETIQKLYENKKYKMVVFTKGDLLDQEQKLERSGLKNYFYKNIVVSNKSKKEFLELCSSLKISPNQMVMIGNSFKSDILPIIEIGGYGIHIPFKTMWQHEYIEEFSHPNIIKINNFSKILEHL